MVESSTVQYPEYNPAVTPRAVVGLKRTEECGNASLVITAVLLFSGHRQAWLQLRLSGLDSLFHYCFL